MRIRKWKPVVSLDDLYGSDSPYHPHAATSCPPEQEAVLTVTATCHCVSGGGQATCPIHGCTCGGHA